MTSEHRQHLLTLAGRSTDATTRAIHSLLSELECKDGVIIALGARLAAASDALSRAAERRGLNAVALTIPADERQSE